MTIGIETQSQEQPFVAEQLPKQPKLRSLFF
jgi:hypothetical protein